MTLPDPARSRVVLIGASRFTDHELPGLPAVRNNLGGLAACLSQTGRCTVVADPESPVALVDPIHEAAAAAEDTLLIYYAGHGLVHPRTLGLLLAVVGSAPGRTHTAVPYDLVRENVIDSPATRKVVILDCCYSGRAIGGMADPTTALVNEATVEGTYLLASAPPNKQALSPPGEQFTAFTGALLAVLNEGVPGGPPALHLDLIYRHVRDRLKRAALPEPQIRAANTAGELALIRNPWHWPGLEPIPSAPLMHPSPAMLAIRRQVNKAGLDQNYKCPVCYESFPGKEFLEHFDDEHNPDLLGPVDPEDLTDLEFWPIMVANRYKLDKPIAINTILAIDIQTAETVVVKERPSEQAIRLDHPNIVRVLDILPDHVVMEHIDGRTLWDVLQADGPMKRSQAVEIIAEICDALDFAYQHGARCKIDAFRVMLDQTGAVKLLNLYRGRDLDLRWDLHQVAFLLVELLTGEALARGDPLPRTISARIRGVVRTARESGYQTFEEFTSALRQ